MPLDLIFMGPPGCGQGHPGGARSPSERGLAHIATGDMLRAAVREGTELGLGPSRSWPAATWFPTT